MSTLQNDISQIKKQSKNDQSINQDQDDARNTEIIEQFESVSIENRILKAKLEEMNS